MAKVITFSQKFPSYHPKAGQPTYFIEQVLNAIDLDWDSHHYLDLLHRLNPDKEDMVYDFWIKLGGTGCPWDSKKPHTIRNGHRFKQGEMASIRVWSGKPYFSPQIIFSPDTVVKKTYDFGIKKHWMYRYAPYLNDVIISPDKLCDVSENDGLDSNDFKDWFKWGKQEFDGQIICWKDTEY